MSDVFRELNGKLLFPVDYPSQTLLAKRHKLLVVIGALVSGVVGVATQSILQMGVCYLCFVFVALLLVLPAWKSYRVHNLEWVQPQAVAVDLK
ncbi:signal peptidase complex subunit SPC1 KNAG_0M01390 [Huiozyma naganishii CBS 8797]|uniref:Uncharacterized protein n=1 Tax=Huiozyma naganishii (strain ATCC MYA-139 / BCRC 22969 / CBS 8797 / KCTC 17520 / NBRC 10181 / NCYC 3082 / Yp74L-3) TaxID=1071383 RepID=J7S457_HUIN7|nr:hypothetical protein KNAG_0M01390 [Kazachstania naganishii CBS 8797]CCK72992.1 hypothetical protein KNAG_0M01390 [Kazachstania naganishii CBS 8797]